MGEQVKEKILEIIEIVVLSTLIIARILISSDENTWISLLNYIGLIIAFVSLYVDLYTACSHNKKFYVVAGVFVVALIVLAVFAGLIFAGIITLNTKWNDIILLITLLITLPTRLYESIIGDLTKE